MDIIETSCANNVGLDAVRDSLRQSLGTLPHVRDELPTSFFAVKEHLEKLDADYLPFTAYEELCRDKGVDTSASQELLIGFLHDLGTVLCFRTDRRLRDTNILNPSWVTGGVYRLLNSHAAAQEKGLLRWPVIDGILDDDRYQPDKRQFIVEMMKKFELCYESDDIFLIPDLLTKEEPDTGAWEDTLDFTVRYGVLPSSIIGRLVVRLHPMISQGTVWRTGVVLRLDGNRALVKADREDATLVIRVAGPANGRRGLLTAIRAELRKIEKTIPGLAGEEQVPVAGHPGVWVPYKHLLNLESVGRDTVVPQGLVEEFPIARLLDGIETKADRRPTRGTPGSGLPTAAGELPEAAERPEDTKGRFRFLGLPKFGGIIALSASSSRCSARWSAISPSVAMNVNATRPTTPPRRRPPPRPVPRRAEAGSGLRRRTPRRPPQRAVAGAFCAPGWDSGA
ncbi:hypothetical protein JIG36_10700 [Actinoplanes sp. LDG1-06]|uniref:C-terminal of Roc (COR) domain-containing protein n=1 Tax=Paractinoplanes ovalisporus TaxID=2810368 RepID=A0ABS2A8E9_9ACTN|nr:COR domain-containing protein [Actinoplanes ovalisporus]MBM2616025.1 hypothetical protein [Actinoplanes ovalisporus]